jgi:hypothetical protein
MKSLNYKTNPAVVFGSDFDVLFIFSGPCEHFVFQEKYDDISSMYFACRNFPSRI